MLCVSIGGVTVNDCIKAIKENELAEVRLDKMVLSSDDIKKIFSSGKNIIASFRPGKASDAERLEKLKMAIDNGAAYVDVEVGSSDKFKNEIIKHAKDKKCKLIVSYHNYEATPPRDELHKIIDICKAFKADVVKIACKSRSKRDNARLMGLLDRDSKMIVVGMGEVGKITRLLALELGAFCTYVSVSSETKTAPGQLTKKEMKKS